MYNPEAGSLVASVQSELAELEEAFKQLQKLAVERRTYLSTVEVILFLYECTYFCLFLLFHNSFLCLCCYPFHL